MEKLESVGCVACASRAIAGQVLVVRAAKSCFDRLVLRSLPRLDATETTRRACPGRTGCEIVCDVLCFVVALSVHVRSEWMLQSRKKTVVSYPG